MAVAYLHKVTSGNTNAPSMMIGNKAGELVLEDHPAGVAARQEEQTELEELLRSWAARAAAK